MSNIHPPNRMQTRASNAKVRPGMKAMEALRVHRTKEVIKKEKDEKKAKQDANEANKLAREAQKKQGRKYLAQVEAEVAAEADEDKLKYPRQQVQAKPSKRKAKNFEREDDEPMRVDFRNMSHDKQTKRVDDNQKKWVPLATKYPLSKKTSRPSEIDLSNIQNMTHPSKRARSDNPGSRQVLRRTETELDIELAKELEAHEKARVIMTSSPPVLDEMDVDTEEEDATPRPRKRPESENLREDDDVHFDDEDAYKTPSVLVRKRSAAKMVEDSEESDADERSGRVGQKFISVNIDNNVGGQGVSFSPPESGRDIDTSVVIRRSNKDKFSHSAAPTMPARMGGTSSRVASVTGKDKVPRKPTSSAVPVSLEGVHMHSQRFQAASKSQPAKFTMRTTSSNSIVVSKMNQATSLPNAKVRGSWKPTITDRATSLPNAKAKTRESVKSTITDRATSLPNMKAKARESVKPTMKPTIPGIESDEDDSLEREVALSSPVKGEEYRNSVQTLVKAQVTRKQRAAVDRLPPGAMANNAWTQVVIPTFINLILSGDKPWASSEADLAPLLQHVWDHTYGSKEPYKVQKGTVAFELANQKLCQYRNGLATKAISAVYNYFQLVHADEEYDQDQLLEAIAEFAEDLLEDNNFIYKGMESFAKPKHTGTFQHTLVIQTFSAHFSKLTINSSPPPKGITIGKPYCGLALTVAAIERALQLYSMQKIKIEIGQIHGTKFSISKSRNPNTNKDSSATDFSFVVWGEVTADYLISAQKLKKDQFQQIFDNALHSVARSSGKYKHAIDTAADERLKSHRAELHSESESDGGGPKKNGLDHDDCDDGNRASGSGGDSMQTAGDYTQAYGAELEEPEGEYTGFDPGYNDW